MMPLLLHPVGVPARGDSRPDPPAVGSGGGHGHELDGVVAVPWHDRSHDSASGVVRTVAFNPRGGGGHSAGNGGPDRGNQKEPPTVVLRGVQPGGGAGRGADTGTHASAYDRYHGGSYGARGGRNK